MTNSKMTYIDALNFAIENLTDTAVVEKLTALRDQQVKRNSADRKPTKTQLENEELKDYVRQVLTDNAQPMTVSEIMAKSATLSALSNQKVSALVNAMVRDGHVAKVPDKRVNRFQWLA